MRMTKTYRNLALIGLFGLAACDQTDGTAPELQGLTTQEAQELAVLEEEGSFDIPAELTFEATEVAIEFADGDVTEGRALAAEADVRFQNARRDLLLGRLRHALDEARVARRLIARAMLATGGPDALEALIERIEALAMMTDAEDEDVFDDPSAVAEELQRLATEARERLAQGDSIGAAERALLGEQRARYRRGRRDFRGDVRPARARLAVELAGTAVALATRLVADDEVTDRPEVTDLADRQNRWLTHARRMLRLAEAALANGHFARAVHFAQHAHWSALKAVVLPGGITEEEVRAMVELAHNLFEQAQEAVGDDATELEVRLLRIAGRLIEVGEQRVEAGYLRGVAPLWRAAVISRWLLD